MQVVDRSQRAAQVMRVAQGFRKSVNRASGAGIRDNGQKQRTIVDGRLRAAKEAQLLVYGCCLEMPARSCT